MAITRVCGVPGSGKTTLLAILASRMVRHPSRPIRLCGQLVSESHKLVYSNVPIEGTCQLDVSLLGKVDFGDALLLIDEASLHFNARDYKQFGAELQAATRLHRHQHQDWVLCSQGALDVDKVIRDLSVNLYKCSMLPFGFLKLEYIEPFFDIVNWQPTYGYDWGRTQILGCRKAWRLFDTHADLNPLPPVEPRPW